MGKWVQQRKPVTIEKKKRKVKKESVEMIGNHWNKVAKKKGEKRVSQGSE